MILTVFCVVLLWCAASKTRPYLYRWELSTNIFQENKEHSNFLKEKGIELLVDFLAKDARRPEQKYSAAQRPVGFVFVLCCCVCVLVAEVLYGCE